MVRTVSNTEMTELPSDDDLWAAIKDQLDPRLPGKTPWAANNLLKMAAFGDAVQVCLSRLRGVCEMTEEELLQHAKELQRLRMCVKGALGTDFLALMDRTAPDYPPPLVASLDKLENALWIDRRRMYARVAQFGDTCEAEIDRIENFEPIDWPLWLPWRRPEEDSAPS